MKGKRLFFVLMPLFCCITALGIAQSNVAQPQAQNGVIDLRKQNFDENLTLNGQWLFYWQQLISPADKAPHQGIVVDFPFKWDSYYLNGKRLPSFGYATYKLTVLLPRAPRPLRMAMPEVYSAYRLFVNGTQVAANGTISTTPAGFEPHWNYNSIDVPDNADTLKIVLQIANFAHSKGGISKPLYIGKKYLIDLTRNRDSAFDLLLTGCLFMGGLFFLGLYLFGNRDKAILLFSIFSIVYSYRLIGTDNYVLHTLLPATSWYITTRIEYLSLFISIGLFGLYTRYLYPLCINRSVLYTVSFICFVFGLASVCLPPVYYTQLINPFLVITVFCMLYVPYVYWRAFKNKRPGSVYALASAVALMVIFSISLLHYWAVIEQLKALSTLVYMCFFFLQSLVLSHRVSFVLTQSKQAAEEGLRAKSDFLSTMSHEIRTPLNSVIGMSHLLLKTNPRPDQVEHLDVMLFSANNLLAIVNDILDYNKIEAGKITFEHTEMDLASIARNIINGLKGPAEDKGIELRLNITGGLGNKVMGDPTRTFQVITNLVHNAIKFTSQGYVELGMLVTAQTDKTITINIQVKDTGMGISREKQKVIFERFTQADSSTSRGFGGTGLGLAICKRILELQQSALNLVSEVGKGSTFYFIQTFDKSIKTTEQQTIENNAPTQDDEPLNGISILLVEDNPMNVLVAQKFLQRWGATIDVAVNGLEALDKVDPTRHNLILMDLQMPVMDGYQSATEMRARGITIPIVALTANLPAEVEERTKQVGINDIVVKPFLPDELFRKVLHHVR
ncbi:signal transduction histidine kinase [Mucilaginibacter gracilis]|uniref:histidine kinase n=1 Tax=Mucilaginibacter gracilis TaxID=423350 RepID=A0A495J7Z3_9SPHI|nr:ATP-binding protein [Mucilaginibacter gracilis]RKR84873.1 signal transduction histidine kinase [Mucilaginibacter gracilis]